MGILSFIGKILSHDPLVKNIRKDVVLTGSINQLDFIERGDAINNIEIGDYIQWSETSGKPGDQWYCGRSCYGIVNRIEQSQFIVTGIGYYGIGETILTCSKKNTICPGISYQIMESHG